MAEGEKAGDSGWLGRRRVLHECYEHRLRKLPHGESVDAWKRFMHGLFLEMSEVAQNKLIDTTEQQMTAVAKASGGHLGIGRVSTKEQQMIAGLTHALRNQTKGTEQ